MNKDCIRIANVQGFWGDNSQAPREMLEQAADVDYLTLDYLAEVSMSILAKQRARNPELGYAQDYLSVVATLAPFWKAGRKTKIISNCGGLAPRKCALECVKVLREAGCQGKRIAIVSGDDVLPLIQANLGETSFNNLDSGEPIAPLASELITANAYIGAEAIALALRSGADMVIAGRVADPSLAVAPCLVEHDWDAADYAAIAGATIGGHLIECGVQVCGGISSDWWNMPKMGQVGFPIVEINGTGEVVVTKPAGTGGSVNCATVKEQLLYELGDPGCYLSPDATVSFLSLEVEQQGADRVFVRGAVGSAPPSTLKVSATFPAGYKTAGTLTICGPQAAEKAERCGQLVLERLSRQGLVPQRSRVEVLGAGACVPIPGSVRNELQEVVLRVAIGDHRQHVLQRFCADWNAMVTAGPQGTTGYAGGRPRISSCVGYWPCLVERSQVHTKVEILEV